MQGLKLNQVSKTGPLAVCNHDSGLVWPEQFGDWLGKGLHTNDEFYQILIREIMLRGWKLQQ